MSTDQFKSLYENSFYPNTEYEYYLNLWTQYRSQTHHLPFSESKKAFAIYRKLFHGIPKTRAYQLAKMDSLLKYQ